MLNIYLVGTHHSYQKGPCPDFGMFLEALCHDRHIRAIGEEMNRDFLGGSDHSVPFKIAVKLNLLHRYCDPDIATRNKLGIINQGAHLCRILDDVLEEEKNDSIQQDHRKRENYWIDQLRTITDFPVLFICGSDHIEPFYEKLRQSGYHCDIVTDEWMPEKHG